MPRFSIQSILNVCTEEKICSYPVPCSFRTWLITGMDLRCIFSERQDNYVTHCLAPPGKDVGHGKTCDGLASIQERKGNSGGEGGGGGGGGGGGVSILSHFMLEKPG